MRYPNNHKHKNITITVEENLYELFSEVFPDVNLSYFLELCMQKALELAGIKYKLYEDELLERRLDEALQSWEVIINTNDLSYKVFDKDLFERVLRESDLYAKKE